jgi:ribose transport system substrate-binding protein
MNAAAFRRFGLAACGGLCFLFAWVAVSSATQGGTAAALPSLDEMRRLVADAGRRSPSWTGPRTGPAGVPGKTVAIISEDLRNGGILGVAEGVNGAAKVMGWNVRVFDAGGTPTGRIRAAGDALAARPDGLIVIGADAKEMQSQLELFAKRGVPIVGWHVAAKAGVMPGVPVAMNVSTDPQEVARITAMAAVVASRGRGGVVIFTDSNFAIAMSKANAMADVIRACRKCTLLEMRDVPISSSAERMPAVTRELLAHYGRRWTQALAINDIYFDYAVPEFTKAGLRDNAIGLFSAGDGSDAAFQRIQAGVFQIATVAEPLNLQGWQLVDELNRLLAGRPVSGYVVPVHIVTSANAAYDGGSRLLYDPDNGYRDIYRRIWKR